MNLGRSSLGVAAIVLATLQITAPAKAETWSLFPWFTVAPPEKPRVTSRIEQVQPVARPAPALRQGRVYQPVQQPVAGRSLYSQPYMIVGLGI